MEEAYAADEDAADAFFEEVLGVDLNNAHQRRLQRKDTLPATVSSNSQVIASYNKNKDKKI